MPPDLTMINDEQILAIQNSISAYMNCAFHSVRFILRVPLSYPDRVPVLI